MKKLLLAAVAMTTVSSPAFAATSNNPVVTFTGTRATVCEVRDFDPTINFGNLGNTGAGATRTDTLDLFCNVRFDASVTSANGYLKLVSNVPASLAVSQSNLTANGYPGFNSGVDYQVQTQVGTANTTQIGAATPVQIANDADPINVTTQVIYSTLTSANGNPLLGGVYNDTLTLTITPIPFN